MHNGFGYLRRTVARVRRLPYDAKKRVGITPDPELMKWVLERVGPGKRFASITHAFECGIVELIASDKRAR